MAGGAGDDVYLVPNTLAVIVEKPGEGIDTVIAKVDWVLGANVENLVLSSAEINGWTGTGNELNNKLTGNMGPNKLYGMAGDDTIDGGGGADILVGGAGSDWLIGGAGADIFRFSMGDGKDTIVDLGAGDSIDILAFMKAGIKATLMDSGPNMVINMSNGDSITVLGHHAAELHPTWYGWVI